MVRKPVAFFLALILLCSAFVTGCGKNTDPSQAQADAAAQASPSQTPLCTFTDSTQQEICLQKQPQRVAVLFSSYAQVWQLAGGTVSIGVGDCVKRGFAEDGITLVDEGAGLKIDIERLIAAEPDFVIASADIPAQVEACDALRAQGVPCAAFSLERFDEYLAMLRLFTQITGDDEAYQRYGTDCAAGVEEALAQAQEAAAQAQEAPQVLFIRAGSGSSATRAKTAEDHFVGIMLEELGAVNIADDAPILTQELSLEYILMRQPQMILIVTQGDDAAAHAYMDDVFSQEGWRQLDAVQTGQVHYLPRELFHYKPNDRWDEAYASLAALLYPQNS